MHYEINSDTLAISIYDEINPEPFWFQPDYPNGDKFDSLEEATAWAEAAIASHQEGATVNPPNGKNLPGEPKLNLTAIAQAREALLTKLGITEDEARLLLSLQ